MAKKNKKIFSLKRLYFQAILPGMPNPKTFLAKPKKYFA